MENKIKNLAERCQEDARLSGITDSGNRYCFIKAMKDQEKHCKCKYLDLSTIYYTEEGVRYKCNWRDIYSKRVKRILLRGDIGI